MKYRFRRLHGHDRCLGHNPVDYTQVGHPRRRAGGVRHFRAGALNRPFRATSHRHDRLTQAVGLGYG